MQWWNNFVEWLYSEDGWRVLSGAIFPFIAIIVAGLIAAVIGRGATRRLIALHESDRRTGTVTTLIGAARRASKWNTLSSGEQQHAEHLAHEADVAIRLLPLGGAVMVADWAAHEIAEMKKNSVSFSFQAEQSLLDFRDRLVEWQIRPSRAKKLFKPDLDLWAYESTQADAGLVEKQQEWAKRQVASETGPVETISSSQVVPEPAAAPKPISWQTPAVAATAASVTASTQSTPTTPAHTAPSTPTVAAHTATLQSPSYSTASQSTVHSEPGTDSGESPQLLTPNPVSANTVRQRTLPDLDDDDLR